MNLDKWNDFLANWARAVSAYGTPADFVAGARAVGTIEKFDEKDWALKLLSSANNSMRRELMAKQKPYITQQSPEKYGDGINLDLEHCFLCQNVAQGLDAAINPQQVQNNVIQDRGEYLIMPNRYPAFIGHSLFVPKNHDEISSRIAPQTITEKEKKRMIYPVQEGKTAGDLTTPDYLDALVEACNVNNLVGLNNHVRDGMSIPGHKHFHLYPEDLDLFHYMPRLEYTGIDAIESLFRPDMVFADTPYGEDINRIKNTPFNTLAVLLDIKRDDSIETASRILSNMEKANEVFTLAYNRCVLLISPRKNIPAGERIQIGAGVPARFFGDDKGMIDTVKKYVPLANENYDWGKFMS